MITGNPGYYSKKLYAEKLKRVYEIASPRVKQYLDAEVDFVMKRLKPGDRVLELGCGYGRVLEKLAAGNYRIYGIDTSVQSLRSAKTGPKSRTCEYAAMDAAQTGFKDGCFDVSTCIQNGISAFNVDRKSLIAEAIRITRTGGRVLFSSYTDAFWPERLSWFRRQADCGLLGEIDEAATGDGVIVCKDGFKATTVGPEEFKALCSELNCHPEITIVNESSVFCEIIVQS